MLGRGAVIDMRRFLEVARDFDGRGAHCFARFASRSAATTPGAHLRSALIIIPGAIAFIG